LLSGAALGVAARARPWVPSWPIQWLLVGAAVVAVIGAWRAAL
jgi:hypothetical protein